MSNPNNKSCNNNTCNSSRNGQNPRRKLSFAQDDFDSDDDDEAFYTANESTIDPYLNYTGSTGTADMSSRYFNQMPPESSRASDMNSGYFNRSDIDNSSFHTADPGTPNRSRQNYQRGPDSSIHSTPKRQRQPDQDPFFYGAPPPSPINKCCRPGQSYFPEESSYFPEDSSFFHVGGSQRQDSSFVLVDHDDTSGYSSQQGQDSSFYHVSPDEVPFTQQTAFDMSTTPNMTSGYFDRSHADTTGDMTSGYFDRSHTNTTGDMTSGYFNRSQGSRRSPNDTTPYSFMDDARSRSRNDTTPYSFMNDARRGSRNGTSPYSGRNAQLSNLNQNKSVPYNSQQDNSIRSARDDSQRPRCQQNMTVRTNGPGVPLSQPGNISSSKKPCTSSCSSKNPSTSNNTPEEEFSFVYDEQVGPQMDQAQQQPLKVKCSTGPCIQKKKETSFEMVDQPQDEAFVHVKTVDGEEPFVLVPDCLTGPKSTKQDKQPAPIDNNEEQPIELGKNDEKSAERLSQRSKTSQKSETGKKSKIPQRVSSKGSGKSPGGKDSDSKGKKDEDKKLEEAKQDSINMLSVVISTIMLLAADVSNIPENYTSWTVKYLKCIKNAQGQYPANIKKILMLLTSTDEMDGILKAEKKCKCPYTPLDKTENQFQM